MSRVTGKWTIKGYLGRIRHGDMDAVMDFQFNPSEISRTRTVDYNFNSPPGSPLPTAQFKGIQGDAMNLSLLFDAVENYSDNTLGTTAQKAFIESLTQPDFDDFSDDLGLFVPPPQTRLGIGEESWSGVLTSVNFRDVRWNRNLIPTRTWIDIQFRSSFGDVEALRARFDFLQNYLGWVIVEGV